MRMQLRALCTGLILIGLVVSCGKPEASYEIESQDFESEYLVIDAITDSTHITIGDSAFIVSTYTGDSISLDFSTIDTLISNYDTVQVEGKAYFIIEGDLLMDFDEMLDYYQWTQDSRYRSDYGKLVAQRDRNGIIKWPAEYVIKYAIHKNTFGQDSNYHFVKSNLANAIQDWQLTCNVRFEHVPECDDVNAGCFPGKVDFIVREINSSSNLIAKAFFPNDPPDRRKLLINHHYYTTDFNQTGVLRHELGHILGFRHEHMRAGAPKGCGREGGQVVELTEYDPTSVMHYFCGQIGSKELQISNNDRTGAQRIYGPPNQ